MRDLSVLVPARCEEWLGRTIDDVLAHREADTEVIVILDGAWPTEPLAQHPDVQVVYRPTSIGQRAATNLAARLSRARYVMKLDAHCSLAPGFDAELIRTAVELGPDVTQIPAQKNLHIYDWLCDACGWRHDQGPTRDACPKCGSPQVRREALWVPRPGSTTTTWRMDADLHFQYWKDAANRKEKVHDVMTSLGACFFMTRERFWELGGLDEACGSWGQFGVEIAAKSWLSGGRQVCNTRTWFAHFFRVGGIGFPYEIHASDQEKAREYSRAYWRNNSWPGQVHPFSWLVEKFWPVPGWTDQQLAALKKGKARKPRGVAVKLQTVDAAPAASEPASKADEAQASVPVERPAPRASKGIVYYSDVLPDAPILEASRRTIERSGLPIVAVTLKPIEWPAAARRIVLPLERGYVAMFKQLLAGLEALETDFAFICEHDVLYHPSHFCYTPERPDVYWYNENTWKVNVSTGEALFYWTKQTSGLVADRQLLVQHYRKRVERVEREGFTRAMGFEPGCHHPPRGVDHYPAARWMSEYPNLDIRHGHNLTASRWRQDQFRDQRNCQGWKFADEVDGWGRLVGRMAEVLAAAGTEK